MLNKKDFGTGSGLSARQKAYQTVDTMNSKHKSYVSAAKAKGALSPKLQKLAKTGPGNVNGIA